MLRSRLVRSSVVSAVALGLVSTAAGLGACSGKRQGAPPPSLAPAVAADPTLPPPDPREAALSSIVRQLFEERHLLQRPIDDTISRDALTGLVDRLDPGKMFLLESDRQALSAYADQIDD